jgi:hypothetical protein
MRIPCRRRSGGCAARLLARTPRRGWLALRRSLARCRWPFGFGRAVVGRKRAFFWRDASRRLQDRRVIVCRGRLGCQRTRLAATWRFGRKIFIHAPSLARPAHNETSAMLPFWQHVGKSRASIRRCRWRPFARASTRERRGPVASRSHRRPCSGIRRGDAVGSAFDPALPGTGANVHTCLSRQRTCSAERARQACCAAAERITSEPL